MKKPPPDPAGTRAVRRALSSHCLDTVCVEAKCPNRNECFKRGTATFMILGSRCTRDCRFCAVRHGPPGEPDPTEPARVAAAARALNLKHVVVTSVTRDDLPDGGAHRFVATIEAIRKALPAARVEVLVPDFDGNEAALDSVLRAGPDVLGHNLETVRHLYALVRPGADYGRSIGVLERAAGSPLVAHIKTAFMLGLGETSGEIRAAMLDARVAGVDILCMGQYLCPTAGHHPVDRFVPPGEFEELGRFAMSNGFAWVSSGPFVRSSYHADMAASGARARHEVGGRDIPERSKDEDKGHGEALRTSTRTQGLR